MGFPKECIVKSEEETIAWEALVQYVATLSYGHYYTPGIAVEALIKFDSTYYGPDDWCAKEDVQLWEVFPLPVKPSRKSGAGQLAELEEYVSSLGGARTIDTSGKTIGGSVDVERGSKTYEVTADDPHGNDRDFLKTGCKVEQGDVWCCIIDSKVSITARLVIATKGGIPVTFEGGKKGEGKAASVHLTSASKRVNVKNRGGQESGWVLDSPEGERERDVQVTPIDGYKWAEKQYRARVEHCGQSYTEVPNGIIPADIGWNAVTWNDDDDTQRLVAVDPMPLPVARPHDPIHSLPVEPPHPHLGRGEGQWQQQYAEFLIEGGAKKPPFMPPNG
jgi:hypothetical protein